ncbi:MAG: hypothetical protein J0L84_08760, partial [Verrucomicrobia bacterium]|nr:hypothetical protein [Verrucomicrobiota bacterium]
GNALVVGARAENSSATGVDGNQAGLAAPSSGAAYVFRRTGSDWVQEAFLKASNTGTADLFGSAVVLSGDRVAVGAPQESGGGSGTSGDPSDNSVSGAGAVYVFARSGASWSPEAYLKASRAGARDLFGSALAMVGDTLMVGAPGESARVSGVNGSDDNDDAPRSGAAYRFSRRDGAWSAPDFLKAANTGAGDEFGAAVAVMEPWLVAGAFREDGGPSGDGLDDSASDAGAAYVFSMAPPAGLLTIREIAFTGSTLRLSLALTPGQSVGIEYSESGPGGPWLDLGLLPNLEGLGTFEETDPVRAGRAIGYYRAVLR